MMMAKVFHHGTFPEDLLYFFNKWSMIHITQEDARISEYTKTPGRVLELRIFTKTTC